VNRQWYGTSTDIDALKQAEEKLREDERALRGSPTRSSKHRGLDPDGIPIYANRATLDYTGLTLADVVGRTFARESSTEDLERVRDQRQAALAAGVPFEFELRALSKEGQYRWFLTRYKPSMTNRGAWSAVCDGTDIDDVNERKTNAEREMSVARRDRAFVDVRRDRGLFGCAADGVGANRERAPTDSTF